LGEENNVKNMFDFSIQPVQERDYYGFEIDGNHRFVLGDFTVTHNTAISINIACQIKLKTLVIVNKIILMKQWEESILKFCPTAAVQRLTPKSELLEDIDFYIINAINVSKRGKNLFRNIRTCIVDECHLIMAETLSKSLNYVQPRYLIGLSATPL
jgi:superfamily II DNA or RNA helicase